MRIARSTLEGLIRVTLSRIPPYFRKKIENLDFTIEEAPNADIRSSVALRSGDLLMGLYQGLPRTRRGADYGNVLPDKITLYRRSFEAVCRDRTDLKKEVEEVVLHELGHYFGLSERELRRLRPRKG